MLAIRRTARGFALAAVVVVPPLHPAVHRHHLRHPHRSRAAAAARDRQVPLRAQAARHIHRSSDPGVTIADFSFAPGTITVKVGDTVTWSNSGPSAHTATASDGSFDTGVLQKGASASHTFTRAGTFSYECKIHPFMHGTVLVTSTTTTATPSSGAAGTTTSKPSPGTATPAAPTTISARTLPATGTDVSATLACAFVLTLAGALLRRRAV